MSSLKTYLHGIAPIIGLTPGALYERQRSLVKLGLLTPAPGRGPGSGVLLTPENAAAVIISALAAEGLSDVDARVVALCEARYGGTLSRGVHRAHWGAAGKPTFRSEVASVLSGQNIRSGPAYRYSEYHGIRVSRCWRGQIMRGHGPVAIDFFVDGYDRQVSCRQISVTAEIETEMLHYLVAYTQDALSQTTELDEEG
ncbi:MULTISPECIES: hypothetical protein [unclassified Bradyrhizobium]|uniref:hypothetical protein n=1 Tax=unclassified Bradyrhizobium TaxID=2631580 RepID=UPI002FEF38EF